MEQSLALLFPFFLGLLQRGQGWGFSGSGPTPWSKRRDGQKREPGAGEKPSPCFPVLHRLTSPEPPVTTSAKATPELSSTHSSESPGPPPGNSSTRPCHPEIRQSPVAGGLELFCEAVCDPGVAVGWTQAPGGLEAYQRWEAGAQAWLSVPWASCSPEGWFRCRLDPGGQMASLYLVPEICSQTTPPALWMGSLVLGLLFSVFLTYRLWKHCRPTQ
ncbi:mucosal addressin cell adhesion molecule 1-like [Leptonychotes weddellii]|uniref:Mucosal addressin cell adhesion molecule 1-like n=1 Tax=Leptonychotes weddellii TaxID=9713 RepID=A0A7F8REU2_LEPWE|nr:mucosal addressin cell adhesion molecule 1-like [Leptonychotes weddellii]